MGMFAGKNPKGLIFLKIPFCSTTQFIAFSQTPVLLLLFNPGDPKIVALREVGRSINLNPSKDPRDLVNPFP
jgi:hypothetical protein